ncbi:hypothetical protein WJX73_003373 [Symbiochloris irregularis]|uniref:Thioesterase domain-containing protein n=1 Tax=Symbiochloris irregularis TaxID=706552 RepID=A0AAW1P3H0_9CHLO
MTQAKDNDAVSSSVVLEDLPWVQDMLREGGWEQTTPTSALLEQHGISAHDNLLGTFLHLGLLRSQACLYHPERHQYCSIFSLGDRICGHPKIVHGGFTAALMDDAFGAIVYISKEKGHVDPGAAFTVHLEVDYKAPVPAGNVICCTTEISRIEGRKIFGAATVADKPGGTTYASGSAIFVNPKPKSAAALSGIQGGPNMRVTKGSEAAPQSNENEARKADANGNVH